MDEILTIIDGLSLPSQIELHEDNDVAQNGANITKASGFVQLHNSAYFVDQPILPQLHGENIQLSGILFSIY